MRNLLKDKRGGYLDAFLYMIFAVVIIFISVIMIYMGSQVSDKLHTELDNKTIEGSAVNYTATIDNTIGKVNTAYASLYWISVFLMIGMALAVFIGSYMVQTKPVFFIPYVFLMVIAIIVAVEISNAYETVSSNATLSSTFAGFVGANFIMGNLPIWITVIGLGGGIIMFARMNRGQEEFAYG
jgi:hypothetical protein